MLSTPSPSLTSLVALALLILSAPIIPGIVTRVKSFAVGRRGPPVGQLYADLWKLARRGTVYSTTTTWAFRLGPVALVATTLAAATLLPLDGRASAVRFAGDAVAFAYLLALGRFAIVLAALDTGSSFEGMGASREVAFASMAELGLFIALAALGLMAHSFTLSDMLGEASAGSFSGGAAAGSSVLLAVSLFALALAECSRVPVDDPATHLELTMIHEVMALDHSGPDLAMILYASALKMALFAGVIVNALIPGLRGGGWTGIAWLLGGFVVIGAAIGIVESVVARLRLVRVPLYIAAGSSLALLGLLLQFR
ncbi:MAG: respiratory chain complex I subunit 1 family protein [Gemmatimonadaceae bacterium]